MATTRIRRHYDHRLRRLVQQTGDVQLAAQNDVPRSTARDWLRFSTPDVVSLDVLSMPEEALQQEVIALRRRNATLVAILRLVVVLLKVSGSTIANCRIADSAKKLRLLRAVERSRNILSLRNALRILGLSSTRYHVWKRNRDCALDDIESCPRSSPQELTLDEVGAIKGMVTSDEYRHVPTGTLAVLAQRLGKVFASPATWYRFVRRFKWIRPRRRLHPSKPKVGIRAATPNDYWHVDTTIICLFDGARAYLHAVIDNFSRRILAWKVSDRFEVGSTASILLDASRHVISTEERPTLIADAGVENVNSDVDALIESGVLRRRLAMTEISYSNSMIEPWWRSLKHQWLYLNSLDSVATVTKLVAFYVSEHNERIPHSAFRGQTPDAMYFGTGAGVPAEHGAAKKAAREVRLEKNRATTCEACR